MSINTGFCPLTNVNNLFKIWQIQKNSLIFASSKLNK